MQMLTTSSTEDAGVSTGVIWPELAAALLWPGLSDGGDEDIC